MYYNFVMYPFDYSFRLFSEDFICQETDSFLIDYYLPIINYKAFSLYLILRNMYLSKDLEGNFKDIKSISSLNEEDVLFSLKSLESIGLIKTYQNSEQEKVIFAIYSPLYPDEFFNEDRFAALLKYTLPSNLFDKILKKYKNSFDLQGFTDISSKFEDSFSIESSKLKDKKNNLDGLIGKNKNKLDEWFDYDEFLKIFKGKHFTLSLHLNDSDKKRIKSLAAAYNINEKSMSDLLTDSFKIESDSFDFDYLELRCKSLAKFNSIKNVNSPSKKIQINSDTELANKINLYERTNPNVFLKSKQGGISVAQSDSAIIYDLMQKYNFTSGMVNAILDYTLEHNDGDLNRNYIEKIATSMVRKKVDNTLLLMDNLYGKSYKKSRSNSYQSRTQDQLREKVNSNDPKEEEKLPEDFTIKDPFGDD